MAIAPKLIKGGVGGARPEQRILVEGEWVLDTCEEIGPVLVDGFK